MNSRILPRIASICLLAVSVSVKSAGEPALQSLQSQVVFGTTCARCHEGECSGRLAFDTGATGAAGHIRRHAGALPDGAVEELFRLLEKMKRECRYPSPLAAVPHDGAWSADALSKLRAPSQRDYLVPLGTLEPGRYLVELHIPKRQHIHLEVLTREFELLLDEPLALHEGIATVSFVVERPRESVLRLHGQQPILLEQMFLRRAP